MKGVPLPYRVILASASPRRKALLSQLVPEFEIDVADVDETPFPDELPWALAERLAETKAAAIAARWPDAIVFGGDTVVTFEDSEGRWRLLAKPIDEADACAMLRTLSDREHRVVTGYSVRWPGGKTTGSDTTRVRFRSLSDDEILAYVRTGEPMDKAGSYAIQGGAAPFVATTEGSISNVVGLPLEALEPILRKLQD